MSTLFDPDSAPESTGSGASPAASYTAHDIEVLEGLEPVRRRPGMYIGGTDERALHHLCAELLDNAMDEAVAGHANRIELHLDGENRITVKDNGRGIPVDPHPKYPDRSALEVILTTLHSGGKFSNKAYQTAGGLHGVGISVVNALAEELLVEVARERQLYRLTCRRGTPQGALQRLGAMPNRRGTAVSFTPDAGIFGAQARFKPATLYRMARSKAYLFRGVELRWSCEPSLIKPGDTTPDKAVLHFPKGLEDFLSAQIAGKPTITAQAFAGEASLSDGKSRLEWAIHWLDDDEDGFASYYCNTVPTPQGGTHETGLRAALVKGLRAFAELTGNKRAKDLTADDALGGAVCLLSLFIPEPSFQGQTKEKLATPEATRLVEQGLKDRFDLWLASNREAGTALLDYVIGRAEERLSRKKAKEVKRQSATRKLRLPGKLADCSQVARAGTELFLVEGDSAGGSAKQARARETQAILPLRGKILNTASASADKLAGNKELADLLTALGVGTGKAFAIEDLRYEKVIIMTDADVDGAHIAALLMTFFYQQLPQVIRAGRLYLARPPLYRLSAGGTIAYAADDADRARLLASKPFKNKKVETSRFKGLGEMDPKQLRETTMQPGLRTLLRVEIAEDDAADTAARFNALMGKKPELRLAFIQENARTVEELDL